MTIDYSPTYASARKGDRTLYVVESTRKHDRLVSVSLGKVTYNPTDPHDWYGIEPLVVIRAKDLPQLIAELSALYADRHAPLVCPF